MSSSSSQARQSLPLHQQTIADASNYESLKRAKSAPPPTTGARTNDQGAGPTLCSACVPSVPRRPTGLGYCQLDAPSKGACHGMWEVCTRSRFTTDPVGLHMASTACADRFPSSKWMISRILYFFCAILTHTPTHRSPRHTVAPLYGYICSHGATSGAPGEQCSMHCTF